MFFSDQSPYTIRLLDPRQDMTAVADLIEICFGSQLDSDSFAYLAHIRKAAADQRLIHWSYAAGEMVSYPLNGYVCEKDGRIVGNLSIIPFYWKREWYYMIANVAVHPEFRQQGMARALTAKTLDHLRMLPIRAAWLQVREDNLPARHLYETFHFANRCIRDTWISTDAANNLYRLIPGMHIETVRRENWPDISAWFSDMYPPDVAWNFGFDAEQYKPGLLSNLQSFLTDEKPLRWSAKNQDRLAGAGILRESNAFADQVFLALPPDADEKVITALLPYIKVNYSFKRILLINVPAHLLEGAFPKAGFELTSRLIWMEIRVN